jgi:hypothetical protein
MDWHLANKQQKLSFNAYQPDLQGTGASPGQDLISVAKWPQSDCSAQLVVLLPCKSQQKLFSFLKQLTCDDPRNDGVGLVWFQLGFGRSSQVGHWQTVALLLGLGNVLTDDDAERRGPLGDVVLDLVKINFFRLSLSQLKTTFKCLGGGWLKQRRRF